MHDAINHWIAQYGALGVFLAAAIEGELGVLIGGALAHLGKLNPLSVGLAAWIAAFLSAQFLFYAVRTQRDRKWVQKTTDKRAFALAIKWIDRHPTLFCIFYRFIYGMRIVGPVALSLSHMKARTYLIFNLCTALAWAVAGVSLGWFFGPELGNLFRAWLTPQRFGLAIGVALSMLVGVIVWRAKRAAWREE